MRFSAVNERRRDTNNRKDEVMETDKAPRFISLSISLFEAKVSLYRDYSALNESLFLLIFAPSLLFKQLRFPVSQHSDKVTA